VGQYVLDADEAQVAVVSSSAKRPRTVRARTRRRKARPQEPATFYEASRSVSPTILSPAEVTRRQEIQRIAERDPEAYMEACRAEAH
jgi:hypothetical protein